MAADQAPRSGRLAAFLAAALVVTGCAGGTSTLDGALPVPLRVSTTTTTVELDAPTWSAPVSAIYLCPAAPPPLPDSTADRQGWAPGGDCHDFGRHPSRDGLAISLPIADLAAPDGAAFTTATDWYVMVLALEGDLVTSAMRSRFHAPDRDAAS
jgi:hypothetical protein